MLGQESKCKLKGKLSRQEKVHTIICLGPYFEMLRLRLQAVQFLVFHFQTGNLTLFFRDFTGHCGAFVYTQDSGGSTGVPCQDFARGEAK